MNWIITRQSKKLTIRNGRFRQVPSPMGKILPVKWKYGSINYPIPYIWDWSAKESKSRSLGSNYRIGWNKITQETILNAHSFFAPFKVQYSWLFIIIVPETPLIHPIFILFGIFPKKDKIAQRMKNGKILYRIDMY